MELGCTSPHNKLLLLIQHLLLLSHMATADDTVDLNITQHPPEVNISKGDSVMMMCSWTIRHVESIRVNWLKERISIFTNTSGEHREGSRKYVVGTNYSSLTIQSARLNDSAMYHCEVLVEIPPPVRCARGEGTMINVYDIGFDAKKNFIVWILAAASPILLAVVIALCCCFWKAKCRQWNDSLVYENTAAIKKEAVKEKKEKSSQHFVNSSELGLESRKTRNKSDNFYENISVQECRKHQAKNKVIFAIYQNNTKF